MCRIFTKTDFFSIKSMDTNVKLTTLTGEEMQSITGILEVKLAMLDALSVMGTKSLGFLRDFIVEKISQQVQKKLGSVEEADGWKKWREET